MTVFGQVGTELTPGRAEVRTYVGHGLRIATDIAVPLTGDADTRAPHDIVLVRGRDREVPGGADPGSETFAQLADVRNKVQYRFWRDERRTVLSYPGLCEFVGDRELRSVSAHLAPGADPGYLSVLSSGAVLAAHLTLRGHLVLHASAVRTGSGALAFVGASGMGKSTMATLLCADGHELVSDDVLRVAPIAPGRCVSVHAGGIECRLREKAHSLAARTPYTSRRTADGRLAVQPRVYDGPPLALAACVVPLPSRDADRVQVRRLSAGQAVRRLLQFPRIVGWTEGASTARNFEAIADLVAQVPVFDAVVPWGPPFRDDIGRSLLAELAC